MNVIFYSDVQYFEKENVNALGKFLKCFLHGTLFLILLIYKCLLFFFMNMKTMHIKNTRLNDQKGANLKITMGGGGQKLRRGAFPNIAIVHTLP